MQQLFCVSCLDYGFALFGVLVALARTTYLGTNSSLKIVCSRTHYILDNITNCVCNRLPDCDNIWYNTNESFQENKVNTKSIDPIRNSAALVDTVGMDVTKDDTKPCTFGYAAK